ncbi:5'/3'-nucleotidase SurE (plasmid) [Prescottella equi]|uniref:5'/3'-nucleotidase SurE n=1 Tax=Rhodococcus hoagii TaxID=43767 RepID=UPI002574C129|nr:5'/3'-nucleotidase SurE [Prescottella equi]WJJ14438.1 5'/3'-nucleotidase SurE [Prescottella equi]
MRALVTNDDGVDSHGISVLARVAYEAGLDVVVAAPHQERSGASASLTALQHDGRLAVSQHDFPDLPGIEVNAVEASPALISFVAASGAFGPPPDIVLSGINHGPNTGHAILHSGTVGAALTGATHETLALAVSLATNNPRNWDTAELVTRHALEWILANGTPGAVLNVNSPDIPPGELKGVRAASLAKFGAVQANIGEAAAGFVSVTFTEIHVEDPDDSDETDAVLLTRGWATATALRAPFEAVDVDLSTIHWTR